MRSKTVANRAPVVDPNRAIEAALNDMSLDIVKIDNILYESGNPDVIKKHARSIQYRASRIVSLLQ